ncbi:PAS domain-containing protein [Luteolibacter sp. GHJ8]|uniref:histidine kinase n=1 Tax=Luteolibacter rhizosphaerae TaxID=2989719 RepID=A0ABT3G783_9BACT|nr:PAS domain-containing protein [Luteolibacter rhizosphaerae]MCW1915709.1 PAS domain-containing protein [Luteolibacter rhizosphaerae]
MNRLTNAILGLSDPALIIARVERMVGEHLKVSRVLVAEAMGDGEHVNVQHTWAVPGMPEAKGIHRLDDYGEGILKDYRAGRMHIRRNADLENPPGRELEALRAIGAMAAIDMPVLVDGEFRVLVVVHQNAPRDWTENEIALMRQVADRTAAEVLRARALKSAQESEFHFRQMADTMPQIVWGSKPDGVPDWFNQRWYDYTGLPHGHLRSEDWRAAFPQEDLIPMLRVWEEALRESKPHSVEARLRRAEDGMMRWHLVRANPVFDTSGKVVRWYGTLTDIHDRKEAAEQTLQSEFRLSGALQMAALGSVNWNLKENVVDMDTRCRALFDFPPDKVLRVEDVFDKIAPEDRGRVETAAAASAKEGTLLEIEYTVLVEGRGPRLISSISRVSLGADGTPEHIYGVLGDVTERRRAEEKREEFIRMIEADRANLAAVVEKSPAFIAVLRGPDHILEVANEKYYELIGRTAQTGRPIREVLPEVEGQGFFEMLDEVYRSGKPVDGTEVPVTLQPEGAASREHFVNFVFQALLGPDKKPAGMFVHGVDVTEPVKAREAIAKSERGRRMALEAAQVGAYNINLLTRELETNEHFRRLIGCTDQEVTYDNALATVHPDDMDRIVAAIAAATRPVDPEPYATEYRVIHPDGSIHWMSARGGVTFEDGPEGRRPASFDGTMSDITERKLAEESMAFQRHQLELIFRESPAAMALWRGEDFVFERVNPHYQALFGNRRLEGLPLLEAVPELTGQGFDAMLRDVLHTGKPVVGHEVLARFARTPDGPVEDFYFDFTYLQVLDSDGKPWGVYDHAIDVTERVLARQALEKSEGQLREALAERQTLLDAERAARSEAEMAGRMKDEFLATLSHELRTPLNAIVGWTQLLQMMPDQSQRLSDGLAVIARNAKAQTQIIEDILDMSRIVSGKLRLDVQKVDLAALVQAGAETVQTAADAKEVKLQVIVDPAAGNISGDPHRLHQVLWNLLSNAVKFTPKAGKVQVTLKRVNSNVEVSVADTGEGIAPEFLPHVFDRFRQADSSSTRHHGGLGLGLAIVKQIVELHGGSVRALSPGKGEGATFIVSLPISIAHVDTSKESSQSEHPAADVAVPLATLDPGQLSGVSIVAVDDEPDAVAFVERLLVGCGAVVHAATSVSQAYALVQTHSPMVIVSDIGMPGEDGYAFLRKVRELPAEQGGRARALAVTAYARSVDRVRALEAGFQMHISKPVDPAELIASVAALANSYKSS